MNIAAVSPPLTIRGAACEAPAWSLPGQLSWPEASRACAYSSAEARTLQRSPTRAPTRAWFTSRSSQAARVSSNESPLVTR